MRVPLRLVMVFCASTASGGALAAPQGAAAQDAATAWLPVSFFAGSTYEKDGGHIRLLSGSVWAVGAAGLLLVPTDVLVVRQTGRADECGIVFAGGYRGSACLVSGQDIEQRGHLTRVVNVMGDGTVLETSDGSLWEVSNYDQYDSGYWSPPYDVIVTADELFMHNLEEGKKIWVSRVGGLSPGGVGAGGSPDLIESRIEGDFECWEGETIFRLTNGQVWQQAAYAFKYCYKYMPEVTIVRQGAGHRMIVNGVSGSIQVERIR